MNQQYYGICLQRLQGLSNVDPAEQGKALMAELNKLKE
jgi:hypothetical protein